MDEMQPYETGFFMAPNEVFEIEGLNVREKLILYYLIRCANNGSKAFPSYNTIARNCSVSRVTAIESVKSLISKKLLAKVERKNEAGDQTSNLYKVIVGSKHTLPGSTAHVPPPSTPHVPPSTGDVPYKELSINNSSFNNKTLSSDNDSIVSQVIAYLNEKTGKRFSDKTKETVRLIGGRVKSGATLDDFKHVINVKVSKWIKDDRMKDFLKPDTLFNEKNFEAYRQESMPSEVAYLRPGSSGVKNENLEETEAFESAYGQLFTNP